MYYYKHGFSFNPDGSFTLSVDYVSALDEMMEDINIMADTEDVVEDFYKHLGGDAKGSMTPGAKQAVDNYIKVVHPTITQKTRRLVYAFFNKVKTEEVSQYIQKHTAHFHQKSAAKASKITNYLLRNNKVYRCTVQGRRFNYHLLRRAFERHVNPFFGKLSFKTGDKMPSNVYDGTVKEYFQHCNIKGNVFRSQEDESLEQTINNKVIRFTVKKLQVSQDTDGNNLFTEMVVLDNPGEDTKKNKGKKDTDELATIQKNEGDAAERAAEELGEKRAKAIKGDAPEEETEEETKAREGREAERLKKQKQIAKMESQNKKYDVFFFQLGDLIDAVLKTSKTDEYLQFEKMTILLGNFVLDYSKSPPQRYPIYKIPIAFETFQEIMKKFQDSTSRRFPLRKFVNELLLVATKYYSNGDYVLDSGRPQEGFAVKTGQFKTTETARSAIAHVRNLDELYDVQAAMAGQNVSSQEEQFVYHYGISPSSVRLNPVDARNIVKFEVGNEASLIKKISYKQVDDSNMKAKQDDNVITAYKDGNGNIIPMFFNIGLTTVGTIDIEPGYCFYIKPSLIGVSDINWSPIFKQVGLTTVAIVQSCEHTFSLDGYTTSFKANSQAAMDWETEIRKMHPKAKREAMIEEQEEQKKRDAWEAEHKKSPAQNGLDKVKRQARFGNSTNERFAATAALAAMNKTQEIRYDPIHGAVVVQMEPFDQFSDEGKLRAVQRSIKAVEKHLEAERLRDLANDTETGDR